MKSVAATATTLGAVIALLAPTALAEDDDASLVRASMPLSQLEARHVAGGDIHRGSFSCQAGIIAEGEQICADEYIDSFNTGCNLQPNSFSDITLPVSICGETGTFVVGTEGTRDTDWYRYTLAVPTRVTAMASSGIDLDLIYLSLSNVPNCTDIDITVTHLTTAPGGGSASLAVDLPPGTHYIFVSTAQVFAGIPCGTQYQLDVTTEAIVYGACCFGCDPGGAGVTTCQQLTRDQCCDLSGVYLGDNIGCANTAYLAGPCAAAFEDISATGTNAGLTDESSALVPIGFPFEFYGRSYTSAFLVDNGFLTFETPPGDTFDNQELPDPLAPNSVVAPWWDDLDPGSGGAVYYETIGTAPNRRFVAQWDGVPQFFNSDSNTFQAVLFEGSNRIEFRYGQFTPAGFSEDTTAGIESGAGSLAEVFDAVTITPGTCLELVPQAMPSPCSNLCRGDLNGDGRVDVFDFATLADNFGRFFDADRCDGDFTCDGLVNSFDFAELAVKFGCQGVPFTPQCCQPIGACVTCDGVCTDGFTRAQCDDLLGDWAGSGVMCSGFTPAPFGACCLPGDTCEDGLSAAACAESGGIYSGDCSTCEFANCGPGACCFADLSCVDLSPASCLSAGGTPLLSQVCASINCGDFGACCVCDGGCLDGLTEIDCGEFQGQFQGAGTSCTEDAICVAFGACCFNDGSCFDGFSEFDCIENAGGTNWFECDTCANVSCVAAPE